MNNLVVWPAVDPVVVEEAGTRGGAHSGIDLAANLNDPVLAAFDGTVIFVGGDGARGSIQVGPKQYVYANGEGKTVDIIRADGLISRVGHLNGYNASKGDTVNAGDVIGFAGTTGFSTGVHIHWETRWDRAWIGGNWVNPRALDPQVFTPSTPAKQEEDDIMAIYLEATQNSSPTKPGDSGSSRIWAGTDRVIAGAKYSGVWERSEDGTIRRLFAAEWEAIQAAYAAAGRPIPYATVHGNAIEQMYLVNRAEPKK